MYRVLKCPHVDTSDREGQEMMRKSWQAYSQDKYNLLDWTEIGCLLTIVICRFIDAEHHTFDYTDSDPFDYKNPTKIADALFIWIPIFITLKMLQLFRVFRGIGRGLV